jgi:sulfite exporter TauE/SafE
LSQDTVLSFLAAGIAACTNMVDDSGDVLGTLLVAGLVGGATHCVGMCGPFVLAQTVARLEARPAADIREIHRLADSALVPYHLGRMTTYAGLGAVAGGLTGGLTTFTGLRWISAALLGLAALFFLAYAARGLKIPLPWPGGGEGRLGRLVGRFARPLMDHPIGWRGYGLGVALGFLPCGLLYGAVAAAASVGDAAGGAVAMLAFALGTVPSLVAVAAAGQVAAGRFRAVAARAAPVLLLVNAGILSYLAWTMIA